MKQKLLNKLWLRVGMIVAIMTTALAGTAWADDILNEAFNISGTDAVSSTYNGWSVTRCWGGDGSIRLGASSGDKGQLITPALSSLSGNATLTFEVKRYGTDTGSIGITVSAGDGSVSGDVSVASSSISADSWTSKTVSITGGSSTTKIKFLMSSKRMYLRNVRIVVESGGGTPTPTTYTVTYNDNGATSGSVPTDNNSYSANATVTVLGNTGSLAKTDYTFAGWNTAADGTGTDYAEGATFNISANTTLYAQWTANGGGDTPSPTEGTGIITFGTSHTKINAASVTGNDDLGNTWTITTEGTTSFTANSAYYQVGSGKDPATSITFTTTLASELNITAMSAKFGGFNGTAGTVTLKVGDTTIGTGSLNGTSDVIVNSTPAATGTVLTVTVTGIDKGVKCYYISYTCTSSTDPTCETPTFSPAAGTYTSAQNVTISTATEGATIYYTTDGSNPTINSTQYNGGAINVSSTTTIKAIAAAEDHNNSPVASATYTIVPLEHAGTQADPYTVADAHTAIDANAGITGVYVSGIVCTAANSLTNNKYLTYYISDDGTTTNKLEAYHGLGIGGADFTSADDIQVGDKVVICGNLKKYNSTYEFDADNQLVSIVRPPVISVNSTVDLNCDATYGEIEYTIDNPVDGVSLTATENADWISNIAVTADKVTFNTTANEGEARTATITLSYTGATDKEVTVTQAAYVAPPTPVSGKYVKVTSTNDLTDGQYLIVYETDNVAFNGGLETLDAVGNTIGVTISNNEIAATSATTAAEFTIDVTAGTIQSASGKYIFASTYNNELKTSTSVPEKTNTFSFNSGDAIISVAVTETQSVTLRYNSASNQTRFRYYKSGQEAIQLYKKVESVTVTNAGYATYCSENALDFTNTDIKAYVGTKNGDKLTFTPINQVPANTGMLLVYAGGKTEDIPVIASATAVEGNCLVGVNEETTIDSNDYILNKVNDGVGFYKAGEFTKLDAHKAYIPAAVGNGVKGFVINLDDDATGISLMEDGRSQMEDGVIYNLAGQRISKMQKGINIVNGKKVMVK